MNSDPSSENMTRSEETSRWWFAIIILVAIGLLALSYYKVVWGSVPALVEALDHCRELFCDFNRQYLPTSHDIFTTGQPSPGYFYSSFFALLLSPLGSLRPDQALTWWSLVQLVGVLLLLVPSLDFYRRSTLAFSLYVALLAFSMPLLHNLKWGQISTLVTGAAFVWLYLYRKGRISAVIVLSLASAVKYYVAVLVLVHLVRREWRIIVSFAFGFLLFWSVIPILVLGGDANNTFYGIVQERLAHALATWIPGDINSQYFPSVVSRWLGIEGGRFGWRLAGYLVFALTALIVVRLNRQDVTRSVEWSLALLFLGMPFAIATSWPHYFVFLPYVQTLAWLELSENTARTDLQRRIASLRLLQWALLGVSIVLASMPFFQWIGRWQEYSSRGYLFLANLCLLILAYSIVLREPVRESDHQAAAGIPATEYP